MRDELNRLASRVEALTGPDREVAHDVLRACGWTTEGMFVFKPNGMRHMGAIPDPTASLDAALSLVPEGWAMDGLSFWPASPEGAANTSPDQARATLMQVSVSRMGRDMIYGHGSKDATVKAEAATPALALTAAALRALAEQHP